MEDCGQLCIYDLQSDLQIVICLYLFIRSRNASGYTCLHLAVMYSHHNMVTYLIKQSAEVNSIDAEKHTPLYYAVSK